MHISTRKAVCALVAGALAMGLAAPVASGAKRILSLTVSPRPVETGNRVTVTWELNERATTVFRVARCLNRTCTSRRPIDDPIRRTGAVGLNSFRLTMRVSPGRYALIARTRDTRRRALFRVVR